MFVGLLSTLSSKCVHKCGFIEAKVPHKLLVLSSIEDVRNHACFVIEFGGSAVVGEDDVRLLT